MGKTGDPAINHSVTVSPVTDSKTDYTLSQGFRSGPAALSEWRRLVFCLNRQAAKIPGCSISNVRTERMIRKCALIICALMMTAGCVSRMDDADTEHARSFPAPAAGQGGLYIIRESHLLGSYKSVDLYIDNQKAAKIGSGDFYYTTLPVGSHSLMASEFDLTNAVLTGGDKQSLFFRVKTEEKKNKFVEYNYFNGTFSILPEEDGKKMVLDSDRVAEERN